MKNANSIFVIIFLIVCAYAGVREIQNGSSVLASLDASKSRYLIERREALIDIIWGSILLVMLLTIIVFTTYKQVKTK